MFSRSSYPIFDYFRKDAWNPRSERLRKFWSTGHGACNSSQSYEETACFAESCLHKRLDWTREGKDQERVKDLIPLGVKKHNQVSISRAPVGKQCGKTCDAIMQRPSP